MVARKLLIVFIWVILLIPPLKARSQACTTLGQTPATAFPVCGSSIFKQTSVPACVNGNVPTPCPNNGNTYQDLNPYWYKFTCFTAGTLGLTITPNNLGDDYDWQIFDITGHNPAEVYTNASLFLGCNWSGLTGVTGTSPSASNLSECGSTSLPPTGPPIFSKMPQLILGHNYLLMISHFSGSSQSGYSLSFGGGTASITDTVPPAVKGAQAICDGSHIMVVLNKKMKCSSLAADGSDFSVSPSVVNVTGAVGSGCSSGFDMDTLTLTLGGPMPPGNYSLVAQTGTDGNTLLDNCGTQIPVGESVPFTMVAPQPTPMDSLTQPGCAPNVLQLVFSKKIQCSSIAADGSDFTVTGAYPVSVTGAIGACDPNNNETYTIQVKLSAPMDRAGNFQIHLTSGSDGNTIIDECGMATPVSSLPFSILADTVSADFNEQVLYGCKSDTIVYSYADKDGVNKWKWVFDGMDTTRQEDPPERVYSVFGTKTAQLIVSNGVCSDTTGVVTTLLDNAISAKFEAPNIICPKDYAQFVNNSTGSISSWDWQFGDGSGSISQTPPDHLYPVTGTETKYRVLLIAKNSHGCSDTAVQQIDVLKSCNVAVPSAFTPNGDGLNDYLYPLNAVKADNLLFRVYNRYGQMVFQTNDWTRKWDGTVGGHAEPAGTFVWTLQYTDRDSGKKFALKGTSVLIR
jgi:gliding motility-associated-like protein